jgi:hypothetical protein
MTPRAPSAEPFLADDACGGEAGGEVLDDPELRSAARRRWGERAFRRLTCMDDDFLKIRY